MSVYTIRMPASSNTGAHDLITVKAPSDRPMILRYASITAEAAATSVGMASVRRGTTMGTGSAGTVQEWDPNDWLWTNLAGVDRKVDLTVAATVGNPLRQRGVQMTTPWELSCLIWVPPAGIIVLRLDVLTGTTTLGAECVVEVI